MAMRQLDGELSKLIQNLRQEILNTLAQVEVNIDYPEYDDVEEMTLQLLREKNAASLTRNSCIAKHGKPRKNLAWRLEDSYRWASKRRKIEFVERVITTKKKPS